ncbi:GntR family transcriptional regulator [Streptomyces sp. NPDC001508]|uniref:GntR family transcriptional regulator n=1 Tax=Streptomyces sp. NPDC001508 TaxID=3154656 RepID=UPI00332A48F7
MAKKSRYAEIAAVLAAEIADQPAGTRVSSEHEIAARFAVSRAAARAALQELEARLLVRRVRGAGTFVNRPIDYLLSRRQPPSGSRTVEDAGGTHRRIVRDVRRVGLSEEHADRLRRSEGSPAHLLVSQTYLNGLVSGWNQAWVPVDLLPDLGSAVRAVESLDVILRQMCGVVPVRAWCRVSSVPAPPEVAAELEAEHSRPVWLLESMSRDSRTGAPLMCSESWSRPDGLRIVVELDDRD